MGPFNFEMQFYNSVAYYDISDQTAIIINFEWLRVIIILKSLESLAL